MCRRSGKAPVYRILTATLICREQGGRESRPAVRETQFVLLNAFRGVRPDIMVVNAACADEAALLTSTISR